MAFNLPNLNLTKSELSNWWKNKKDVDSMIDGIFANFYQSFPTLPLTNSINGPLIPRLDFAETDSLYIMEVEIPGIEQKDIEINLEDNLLTVTGKKEVSSENKDKNYYAQERSYGSFRRSITLPSNIVENNIKATFKNGVLVITIPKKENKNAKRIEIKG